MEYYNMVMCLTVEFTRNENRRWEIYTYRLNYKTSLINT